MDAVLDRREPSNLGLFLGSPSYFLAKKIYSYLQRSAAHVSFSRDSRDQIRLVCISDTHNYHNSIAPLPDGDILIHAGDMTQFGTSEELENALAWLNTQPHAYKFFIAGNHDSCLVDPAVVAHIREAYPDLHYLDTTETTIDVRGRMLNIYGSPYTPKHGSWPFQYSRVHPSQVASSKQWAAIPLHTDVLITHGPPAYHLDNDGSGCVALLKALWRVRPRLHVFGYIHAARGTEIVSWTADQEAYEKMCEKKGGWWNLLLMLIGTVRTKVKGSQATLVNASVVGGYRDEPRRDAIVVDI